MNPTIWGPIAVALAGILAFLGSKYTADRSRAADDRSAQIRANEGIASGYSLLTSDLREELNRKDAERREELDRMHQEIKNLRTDVDDVKHRYRNALAYIRLLRAFITDNVTAAMPPPMPDDLTLDLD